MAYKNHLNTGFDLVTAYEKTRSGFVALAIERNRRATPLIDQARVLKTIASQVNSPADLINLVEIQPALLAASGISDKAGGYLQPQDKIQAIQGLIKEFLEPAGSDFIEELVYRIFQNTSHFIRFCPRT